MNCCISWLNYFFPKLVFSGGHQPRLLLLPPPPQAKEISAVAVLALQAKEEPPKKEFNTAVIPTLHCADTQEWRKHLIRAAEHNIVISGNYSGGKALNELLTLIDKRMTDVPHLQVLLISHPGFLDFSNRRSLASLFKKYPTRFYLVESPDIFVQSQKTTNHAKFTIIDYGRYFIMGGSGIKDNFVLTGLDNLTVEKYLELEKAEKRKVLLERDGLESKEDSNKKPSKDTNVLVKTGNFRDQDFVFQGAEAGKRVYRQALFLAYKWDRYVKDGKKGLLPENWNLNDLKEIRYPALKDDPCKKLPKIHGKECVLYRMLKRPIPDGRLITTKVAAFGESLRKVQDVQTEFFFLGPETPHPNPFAKEMMARIKAAVREIIIDHVYFQPTKPLMQELIAAVKRGVKLTVVTAGVTKNCPNGQKVFGPKNIAHYTHLLLSLIKEAERVKVYLFEQNKKGLHKKVVIIDDCLMSGSSNMDPKCLVRMGDHDINFKAQSSKLIEQTKRIILEDIRHSRLVEVESLLKGNIKAHL